MLLLKQVHGAKVDVLEYKDGAHADPEDLRKKLRRDKYKAVFMAHVDTSTSVANPVRELVEECVKADVFSIVDGLCSIGGMPLDFDRFGADIAFTASQKVLAGAPGGRAPCLLRPGPGLHGEARETNRIVLHEPPEMEAGHGRPKGVPRDAGDPSPSGPQGGAAQSERGDPREAM